MLKFPLGSQILGPVVVFLIASASLCPAIEFDTEEFMLVEEIKKGMKGYGLTVFSGTRIDTFQVEVLGVLKNARPKQDIIWARMEGGPLEKTGGMQGMSGSPVYIGGRLIGAVAYAFLYTNEPFAGITPIKQMLEVLRRQEGQGPGPPGKNWQGGLGERSELEVGFGLAPGGMESGFDFGPGLTPAEMKHLPGELLNLERGKEFRVVSLATPLVISGMGHEVFETLSPVLERMGFFPLAAGGSSAADVESPELEPGAMVGYQLVRGDMNMTGYGTLTYRNGERILAFGHPMYRMGETDMPMVTVDVHFLVPDIIFSYKYASAIQLVGTITQDRSAAISGVVGRIPAMIPVTIQVREEEEVKEFQYELVKHRDFTPFYTTVTVFQTIVATGKLFGDYAIGLKAEVDLEGRPPFTVENVFSSNSAPYEASFAVLRMLSLLLGNDFEQVELQSVDMEISLLEKRKSAVLEGIRVDRKAVRPGDDLEITLFIRPYLEDTRIEHISLQVPEDVAEGRLELRVYDARSAYMMERRQAPARFRPRDLSELIGLLEETPRNNEIVVDLFLRRTGATVGAVELPSLPGSMLAVLQASRQTGQAGLTQGTNIVRQRIPMDFVVAGKKTLNVRIDRRAR